MLKEIFSFRCDAADDADDAADDDDDDDEWWKILFSFGDVLPAQKISFGDFSEVLIRPSVPHSCGGSSFCQDGQTAITYTYTDEVSCVGGWFPAWAGQPAGESSGNGIMSTLD